MSLIALSLIWIVAVFSGCSGVDLEIEKVTLMSKQNEVRVKVLACKLFGQPQAAKMPTLKWNTALAAKAQALADKCTFMHDTAAERKVSPWSYVGQNYAAASSAEEAVNLWLDEYKYYNYETNTCNSSQCGHYTQMVWANTTDIGCGIKDCSSATSSVFKYAFVCNYGAGGNIAGQKPYELGASKMCSTASAIPLMLPIVTLFAFLCVRQ